MVRASEELPMDLSSFAPPVRFAKEDVTVSHEEDWRHLNVGNAVQWPPISLKALYVLGIIHDFCHAANHLLVSDLAWPTFYLPAYNLVASGIEILGRVVGGEVRDQGTVGINFRKGFGYLRETTPLPGEPPEIVIATNHNKYNVSALIELRNFATHGQATFDPKNMKIDIELLDNFPTLIAAALERYWNELQRDVGLCELLAQANVVPLHIRADPIRKMLMLFERGFTVTGTFTRFNWHIAPRYTPH